MRLSIGRTIQLLHFLVLWQKETLFCAGFCVGGLKGLPYGPVTESRKEESERSPLTDRCNNLREYTALHAELNFRSSIELKSSTDNVCITPDFFQSIAFRQHCLSAGGSRPIGDDAEWTPFLRSAWENIAREQEELDSKNTDEGSGSVEMPTGLPILASTYTTIQFPGLLIKNTIFVAVDSSPKRLRIWLLGETRKVEKGAAPLVWLFRQLVENKDSEKPSQSRSSTIITLNDSGGIKLLATIAINVPFPSVVLRLLPAKPSTMEEQGSKAVRRVLEKDLGAVVERLPLAYAEWKQSQSNI